MVNVDEDRAFSSRCVTLLCHGAVCKVCASRLYVSELAERPSPSPAHVIIENLLVDGIYMREKWVITIYIFKKTFFLEC